MQAKKRSLDHYFSKKVTPKPASTEAVTPRDVVDLTDIVDLTGPDSPPKRFREAIDLTTPSSSTFPSSNQLFLPSRQGTGNYSTSSSQQGSRQPSSSLDRSSGTSFAVEDMAASSKFDIPGFGGSQPLSRTQPRFSSQDHALSSHLKSSSTGGLPSKVSKPTVIERGVVKRAPFLSSREDTRQPHMYALPPDLSRNTNFTSARNLSPSSSQSTSSTSYSVTSYSTSSTANNHSSTSVAKNAFAVMANRSTKTKSLASRVPASTPAQNVSFTGTNPYGSSRFGQSTKRSAPTYGASPAPPSKRRLPSTISKPAKSTTNRITGISPSAATGANTKRLSSTNPPLSSEQNRILRMVLDERQNIFFTGSAGTGKSVLMRALIDALKAKYNGEAVAVTASTGIAACNINGCTLHSFAGIGMGTEDTHKLIEKVQYSKAACRRWTSTVALIIDEISMVDGVLFDKLEAIARAIRKDQRPFGGIQLVITGDFFQLPPVNPHGPSKFAFEGEQWSRAVQKTIVLTHVFRQKEQTFVDILNEMRIGRLSPESISIFRSLSRDLPHSDIMPAELYPLRRDVEKSNVERLDALPGTLRQFYASDTGDKRKVEQCIAPKVLQIKVQAQVMLLKNLDSTLVNGSLGVVKGFAGEGAFTSARKIRSLLAPRKTRGMGERDTTETDIQEIIDERLPIVEFLDGRCIAIERDRWSVELPGGKEIAARRQVPLMLAWAMSIHKSQGQTLQRARVDLGESFEDGMAYVALSRATSLDSLQVINFNPSKVTANRRVVDFYNRLQSV